MKKLLILLLLLPFFAKAQTTYQLNYDSIRVNKTAGTGGTSLYGKIYLKNVGAGSVADSILSVFNGRIRKISGSGAFIQNQNAGAQSSSNFWIDGNGKANKMNLGSITTAVANRILSGQELFTLTNTNPWYGSNIAAGFKKTDGIPFTSYGIGMVAHGYIDDANTTNWDGDGVRPALAAIWGQADSYPGSSGTISEITAINSVVSLYGGIRAIRASGLNIMSEIGGTAVVDTAYGIRIQPVTIGTLNRAIQTEGTAPSFFGGSVTVPDVAYSSGWDGDLTVPTKNAVWDAFGLGGGFWTRTGTTLSPTTANDNLSMGTGSITGGVGSFTSSGSTGAATITQSSGAGVGLTINKAGDGEGLTVNKTSGSGNAVTVTGTLNATTLVKSGGTSSQFLKADGTVDNTAYGTGSVTSVAALTLGTTGTDLSSSVANGTTTPVITLNVPNASATARGVITTGAQTIAGAKTFTGTIAAAAAGFTGAVNLATTSGDVGIGTTSPLSKFHIRTGTDQNARFRPGTDVGGANGVAINTRNDDDTDLQEFSIRASNINLINSASVVMQTVPATSAGTYDGLTRNTSTGAIEKIGLASGTYTPTLTNATNVSAATMLGTAKYQRVGNIVTVYGGMSFTTGGSVGSSAIGISLPVSSNFTIGTDARGVGTGNDPAHSSSIYIVSDATNDRAEIQFDTLIASTSAFVSFSFSYEIL